jgi:hypothetical protein
MSQRSAPSADDFEIELFETSGGICDCCGTTTKRVWGSINAINKQIGAYFVSWTESKPDHGAAFDLILGEWGENTTSEERFSVALDFRLADGTPQFMVINAADRDVSKSHLVGTALKRSDVIGTPLAPQVFAVIDAIYLSPGLEELRSWSEHEGPAA